MLKQLKKLTVSQVEEAEYNVKQFFELDDKNRLDRGSLALAKLVGGGNVGKAQDAITRSKGETVPNTIDFHK